MDIWTWMQTETPWPPSELASCASHGGFDMVSAPSAWERVTDTEAVSVAAFPQRHRAGLVLSYPKSQTGTIKCYKY